ncbi:N-acetylmuramate alpha-1-phosphate uridylyltransferase MurU [Hydrogenovibrio marinus]|uniref:Mannose-1-phosphate guanylyltransferase n=1 Tax=Hydrogenovibrio marinus TaxID=28885 RepID=A0A067A399_HYDMR|nr:nucleotidyltransferase family protein [Hydrogenovibrio marinus]KDN96840.1 mannose-1-phosphate guanylyltransferase [Hydrogenovibrio marinus]
MNRRAMILAAGRGNRLRPLTDSIPKPLVTVGSYSLIEHHLHKFCQVGVKEVVINHAWLGDKIESALGDGSRYGVNISYSSEPEGGLETAGGILQALPMLSDGQQPFCVVNGDVFTDYPFDKISQLTLASGIMAHLILVPNPDFKSEGDFGLEHGMATLDKTYTFSGVSVLHPALFDGFEVGRLALGGILKQAIADCKVTAELYEGYWSDVGTLERLNKTRQDFESNKIKMEKL